MTQEALAKRADISRGYLARLEIGMHDPTASVLLRIARALKVDLGDLIR